MVKKSTKKLSKIKHNEEVKDVGKRKTKKMMQNTKMKDILLKEEFRQNKLQLYHNVILKYFPEEIRKIYDKLGPYNLKYEGREALLEYRPATNLDGVWYQGQWIRGTQIKQGRAILVFQDSVWETIFYRDINIGKGRTIYNNGDIFEGYYNSKKSLNMSLG